MELQGTKNSVPREQAQHHLQFREAGPIDVHEDQTIGHESSCLNPVELSPRLLLFRSASYQQTFYNLPHIRLTSNVLAYR